MYVAFVIIFLLIFGSLNTLTTKWQFSVQSVGVVPGVEKNFEKPWFGNFAMFLAMALVLIVHYAQLCLSSARRKTSRLVQADYTPLAEKPSRPYDFGQTEHSPSMFKTFLYIGIPAMLDVFGSGLTLCGLVYIEASVWQMLRGSTIIFSAVLSIPLLNRRVYAFHWIGVTICVCGIMCVGLSSVLGPSEGDMVGGGLWSKVLGCLLVLVGQAIQAGQIVCEEKLLKDVKLPSMIIVGYEGIWGILFMVCIGFPIFQAIPGSDAGSYENTTDSIDMIENSDTLPILLVIYLVSCATYNIARMLVTNALSAVHFTMLDASRTCVIWVINLCIYYLGTQEMKTFGETWTPYSFLEVIGFFVIIFGQTVYGQMVILPFKWIYPPESEMVCPYSPMSSQFASPACRLATAVLPPYSPPDNQRCHAGTNPKNWWSNENTEEEDHSHQCNCFR